MLFGKKKESPYGGEEESTNPGMSGGKKGMSLAVMIGGKDMGESMKDEAAGQIAQMLAADTPPSKEEVKEALGAFFKACMDEYSKEE